MITALAMNRVQFVKLFLEYGISLVKNINQNTLEFLYGYSAYSSTSILKDATDVSFTRAVIPNGSHGDGELYTGKNVMELLCEDAGIDINRSAISIENVCKVVDCLCSGIRQSSTLLTEVSSIFLLLNYSPI